MTTRPGPAAGAAARFAAIASLAALAACAHAPIDRAGCNLPMERLVLAPPSAGFTTGSPPASGYEALIEKAMTPPPPPPGGFVGPESLTARPVSLFLSGGSQNGAFGAGFIDEWRERGGLPAFRVVTGVSTGALIGAMVFTRESQRAVDGYTITAESDLLDVRARGLVGKVRSGATGTLAPLRARIDRLLDDSPDDDAQLGRVAAAAADGRKFLVGVVDAREGEAYAIDMTALAARWQAASGAAARDAVKQCYLDALIASSSVPLAAPPVYIDGHMFIDGGVRFGVFRAAESAAMARTRAAAEARDLPAPVSFLIINGRLETSAQCAFDALPDGSCPASGPLRKWDILDLGFRSIDILTNQIYRFSANETDADFSARINPDVADHSFNGTRCADWRKQDDADKPAPVQFHWREMRCLIDYGRTRARTAQWWTKY